MNNAQRLKILNSTGKTVFSLKNLQDLWGSNPKTTKIIAKRMVDNKLISRIERGYFSLDEEFNIYELANLIISPSYVSLNSALFYHSVSFQARQTVTSVSLLNYERRAAGRVFKYYAMKDSLFFNLEGIHYKNNLAVASPERAILDCFYFNLLPNIDNTDKANLAQLKALSNFYPKTVQMKVRKYLVKS
jgi:predicted transcriptional regulator of viral defense system